MNFLAYLHSIGLTHKRLFELFGENNNYEEVWNNLENSLGKTQLSSKEKTTLLENYKRLNTKNIDQTIKKLSVTIIDIFHSDYPENLREISHPPFLLYVRGKLEKKGNYFAVIGSRKMSGYAKKVGTEIVGELSEYFTIVSGGAGGCDTLAHSVCVEKKKKTIVIFGTGIDIVYPSGNSGLFEQVILSGGAIVSIFPVGTPGSAYSFPVRNEIVAGLSQGILVLEAGEKSGTLITAQLALDQGKDVFAVCGDIFHPNFAGNHSLIKKSEAQLITQTSDILETYQYHISKQEQKFEFTDVLQEQIYDLLKYNLALNIDEIIDKSQLSYSEVTFHISFLELLGAVKRNMLGKYERVG